MRKILLLSLRWQKTKKLDEFFELDFKNKYEMLKRSIFTNFGGEISSSYNFEHAELFSNSELQEISKSAQIYLKKFNVII